ncbi:alpha/beta hydrolase [Streptomyces nitrosporeus]|uniref:Alpha/beta hydrolase n=1 Tax=Streptomyces nitrosporeus TaxID=28894 RepID=A0A5J6FKX4_9ACTN|nr:alpha/beta fold hydrolase [Streptomyces nitrosporeus]QEU76902.1 alpha/beta hydrolase [Streptomyces nitrosporeus]GGZ07781.1 hypothetical protein GCM10010327_42770 [Streptomyces nitrosporeus]
MPTFTAPDGAVLAYRLLGRGEPLICLPGGPLRASAYLGDLGGLSRTRRLVLPDPRGTGGSAAPDDPSAYRCDRLVGDVEALRVHLGLGHIDLLAHSAAANLAVLYAARHPGRLRTLTLITPGTRAAGLPVTGRELREAAARSAGEPWYAEARAALEEILAGRVTDAARSAVAPLTYGRWDATARAHAAGAAAQTNTEAASFHYAEGAFDPAATVAALGELAAPVLVVAGEHDAGPRPDRAAQLAALFPHAELAVQPGAGHYPWIDDPGTFARTVEAFLDPAVSSVRAGGIRLAHRTWGDPSAPPLVLAHGRGGDSRDWAGVAARLGAHHRVYALDLRGHGLSDWPGRYSFELFRDDLHGFLEARGLAGATLIGHSAGGTAALLLAQRHPGLVGRLVLEEPPPPVPLDPPRPPAERPPGTLGFDWPVVPATDEWLNDPDPGIREHLGRITAPTLVIGGTRSHVDQEQLRSPAGRTPGGRYAPVDAGHLVHADNPDGFLAALASFGIGRG